ncbi:MAG: hypothetical protein ABIU63_02205 [Chitinophagaceae bacterium]
MLLAVHLFNTGGYSLAFRYFMQRSEEQLVQQLDQHQYNESELLEVSIPLHLPYSRNSDEFERVDGSIEENGTHYSYVKRRVFNDTLYIMVIPNRQKTQLEKDKTSFSSEMNDNAAAKTGKVPVAKKMVFSADFNHTAIQYSFTTFFIAVSTTEENLSLLLHNTDLDTAGHPPKAC